jgi:molybdopterin-guanine dinucleotide biosynthesis protein A
VTSHQDPPVIGAVLCGGRSSRFGRDKALAPAGELLLGQRVVNALRGAGLDPVVAVGGSAGSALGLVTVPDRWPDQGPLAGLATVLWWARDGDVLVVPCDLPLLTDVAVRRLIAVRDDLRAEGRTEAVVAAVGGRPRHSLAIWPARNHRSLGRLVDGGRRRFGAALEAIPWIPVEVPEMALADADTPDQLQRLIDG